MDNKLKIMEAYNKDVTVEVTVNKKDGWFLVSGYVRQLQPDYCVINTDEGPKGVMFDEITSVR